MVPCTKKSKSKPFEEGKKKKKKGEKSLLPILEERRKAKKRLIRLVEESFSSSKIDSEVSAIAVESINMADTATTLVAHPASRAPRPTQRGIDIREPAQEKPTLKEVLEGNGKKKVKIALTVPFRESTPSPIKRKRKEAEENKLREEA